MRLLFVSFHWECRMIMRAKKSSNLKSVFTLSNSSKASLNSALSSSSRLLVILSSDQLVGPILTGKWHGLPKQHFRLRFSKQRPSPTGPPPPRDLSVPAAAQSETGRCPGPHVAPRLSDTGEAHSLSLPLSQFSLFQKRIPFPFHF